MGSSKSGNRTNSPRRPKKGGTQKTFRNLKGISVYAKSALTHTDTTSIALRLLDQIIDLAHAGDASSIAFLAEAGVVYCSDVGFLKYPKDPTDSVLRNQ